ncbi:hypothetical protein [Ralstonia solanacearum]|uniref:hypothetical protein n=1 Tax=Ralstonia solanacearum TaxID=305 RepID=UPI0001D96259|nr:hypothetical protein [Ralstonia solanacearum]CBJ34616.1 conserved hypothethical protein [Ralstonia solanacearum PSI07]
MVRLAQFDSLASTDVRCSWYGDVRHRWINDRTIALACPWYSVEIRLAAGIGPAGRRAQAIEALPASLVELPLVLIRPCRARPAATHREGDAADITAVRAIPALPENPPPGVTPPTICSSPAAIREIAAEAEIDGQIHALCAYSAIRRGIFSALADDAASAPPDLALITHCLQQSHYLTSRSVAALSQGRHAEAGSAYRDLLMSYIAQERGHHLLIREALAAIGQIPRLERVSRFTRYALELLAWSARHHPFAFANALGYFEMSGFLEADPIADALIDLGYPEAARPVQRHFDINRRQGHAAVGLHLADKLGGIGLSDLSVAAHTLERLAFALRCALADRPAAQPTCEPN